MLRKDKVVKNPYFNIVSRMIKLRLQYYVDSISFACSIFFRQVSKKAVARRDFLDILLKSLCINNNQFDSNAMQG